MNNDLKKNMKKTIQKILEEFVDDMLLKYGFFRKNNSLIYIKKIGTTKQKIIMDFQSYYASFVLLYPYLSVTFPRINEIAREIAREDPFLNSLIGSKRNETILQPIKRNTKSERWILVYGKESNALATQISTFLLEHTIPLLADLECEEDIIKMYEKHDRRIMRGDAEQLYVVCAYILNKEYNKALDILELISQEGKRHRYEVFFQYIEKLL